MMIMKTTNMPDTAAINPGMPVPAPYVVPSGPMEYTCRVPLDDLSDMDDIRIELRPST